jgi:hypothetical protein
MRAEIKLNHPRRANPPERPSAGGVTELVKGVASLKTLLTLSDFVPSFLLSFVLVIPDFAPEELAHHGFGQHVPEFIVLGIRSM